MNVPLPATTSLPVAHDRGLPSQLVYITNKYCYREIDTFVRADPVFVVATFLCTVLPTSRGQQVRILGARTRHLVSRISYVMHTNPGTYQSM